MTEAKEAQNVEADGMWPLPVVIAAGGKGTRLRPFTNSIPKELVEVNGTPIIDRIIAQFRARGCEEFWATMDYHAEKLEEHFENVDPGHQVRLVNANGHRGTAAPLKVLQGLVDPPFVLSNCDVLVDADYPAIAREGAENGDALTLESGASGDFSPASVTTSDAGAESPDSGGTGGTRGTAASSKSTVPNTGDAFPLGLLGTALVAAGAATAAYERRRAENDGNRADR